jgi:hypothetical protein
MPAFSHCFLKRFMAFSKDSPSLTRTPVIRFLDLVWSARGQTGSWDAKRFEPGSASRASRSLPHCDGEAVGPQDARLYTGLVGRY